MVEKIEVRTTSGGFIEVTRCEEGVVWVDIKRGDGTQSLTGRLDGFGPSDLAAALDPKLMTRDAAKDLREKWHQACRAHIEVSQQAYLLQERIKGLESGWGERGRAAEKEVQRLTDRCNDLQRQVDDRAQFQEGYAKLRAEHDALLQSTGHGAYQKLNDELAKAKAEVASLRGQVVGRGAALEDANKRTEMWEREAFVRAGCNETVAKISEVFGCPSHDVVSKAELLVEAYSKLRASTADGDTRVVNTSETWKERDARHRETIHQLKQENHNLRTKREEAEEKLRVANRRSPYQVLVKECPTQTEAAHVMSLTKQLEEARNDVKAMQKEVYELKRAGKICAEAMQEWRTKLTATCGFAYPNLIQLADILTKIRKLTTATEADAPEKIESWRKDLTDALELPSHSMFNVIVTEIRHLKTRPKETHCLLNGEGERTIAVLRAQVRAADQLRTDEVERCSDRVKELEERASTAKAVLSGLIAHTGKKP